jgi:hypothetical protein
VSIHATSRRTGTRSGVPAGSAAGRAVESLPWAEMASVRLVVALWGGLAVADVCDVAHAPTYVGLAALAVLVTASALGMRAGTALGVAAIGWLVADGFVVHRLGVLGFDGAPDAARLALLVGLALAATRVRR